MGRPSQRRVLAARSGYFLHLHRPGHRVRRVLRANFGGECVECLRPCPAVSWRHRRHPSLAPGRSWWKFSIFLLMWLGPRLWRREVPPPSSSLLSWASSLLRTPWASAPLWDRPCSTCCVLLVLQPRLVFVPFPKQQQQAFICWVLCFPPLPGVVGVFGPANGTQLTWFPLFRDSIFYSLTLIVLYMFFGVITPQKISVTKLQSAHAVSSSPHTRAFLCPPVYRRARAGS